MNPDILTIISTPKATIVTLPDGSQGYSVLYPKKISSVQIQNEITALQTTKDNANQQIGVLKSALDDQEQTVADCDSKIAQLTDKLSALSINAPQSIP